MTNPSSAEPSSRSTGSPSQLAAFIRSHVGMIETIVGLHRDDGSGHCTVCTAGGQAGRHIWPCQTYVAASGAAEAVTRDRIGK